MKVHNLVKRFFVLWFATLAHQASAGEYLVNYVYQGEFSKETAEQVLKKVPPLDSFTAQHNLSLYKITYKTPAPDGSQTTASGLVAMPTEPTEPVAMVSYQHGTRFDRNDVPSRNNEKNHMYIAAFASSAGFMTVMPDYLGLGDSPLPLHPYVQAETLASSSVNMLLAAKELAAVVNYPISEKLFLAGYSEGGFATMVMFELLAKDYPQLPVSAVAAGSAPYDWYETMDFVLLKPGARATAYGAYFFYSMQTYTHYWDGFAEIFVAPYDTLIPQLFDGFHTTADILKALPADPQMILQPSFIQAILTGSDSHTTTLIENFNHYAFTPTAPLLLVGTKGDHDVPYHGAEMAYEAFSKRSDLVFIKSVSDTLDHLQAHPYVLKEQVEFFKRWK